MKKIFIIFIGIVIGITSQCIKADDLDIDNLLLNKIKTFGVDIKNAKFAELEPIELLSFEDFSKRDFNSQKEEVTYWSTLWHNNLDKLDIITKSSSTLNGYPVTNLFDKRTETAWVPGIRGARGNGIGEWVSITLTPKKTNCPSGLELFSIIPGYLKNDKIWEENNRVKSALLIIEMPEYQKDYVILRLKLKDYKGIQTFKIGQYSGGVYFNQKVWVIIEDVYKGIKYDDTCISEIVINGIYSPSALDGP